MGCQKKLCQIAASNVTNIILVICEVWVHSYSVHHHLHLLAIDMVPVILSQDNSPDSSTKSIDKLANQFRLILRQMKVKVLLLNTVSSG